MTDDAQGELGVGRGATSQASPIPRRTLAEKLDHLFRTVRSQGRGEYSLEEAAQTIKDSGGPTISASYLWLLRKGLKDNPTKRHLEALAQFFGVPPAYFFDDALSVRLDEDLHLLDALRQPVVRRIAVGAAELSGLSQDAVATLVDQMRGIESRADGLERVKPERARALAPDRAPGRGDGRPSPMTGRETGREAMAIRGGASRRDRPSGSRRRTTGSGRGGGRPATLGRGVADDAGTPHQP